MKLDELEMDSRCFQRAFVGKSAALEDLRHESESEEEEEEWVHLLSFLPLHIFVEMKQIMLISA